MTQSPKQTGSRAHNLQQRDEVGKVVRLLRERPLTLREYHAIGRQLRQLERELSETVPGWRDRVAEAVSRSEPVSVATLNKCLQLAKAYPARELAALEKIESRWGFVSMALAVGDKEERHALLERARAEQWNDARLRSEIKGGRPGLSRGGGRTRKPPPAAGLRADLDTLVRLTRDWITFQASAFGTDLDRHKAEAAELAKTDRDRLAGRLDALEDQIERLEVGVEAVRLFLNQVRRRHGLPRRPGVGGGRGDPADNA